MTEIAKFQVTVKQRGNSLWFIIPKANVQKFNIKAGDKLQVKS